VGSPGATTQSKWSGRASVYRGDGTNWHRLGAVSSASDLGGQPVQFGWTVATDGKRMMVGRIDDADGPAVAGRAWLLGVPLPSDDQGHLADAVGTEANPVRDP
jgi:hypothetical protein